MGWSSGCELAEGIWKDLKGLIPQNQIHKTAVKIYDRFCDNDADDWEFKKGNLYYTALKLKDPESFKQYIDEYKE